MKAHQRTIGKNDEWLTPRWILERLGTFDLDPCAPVNRPWPTATRHYTTDNDGLSKPWEGRVWLNPPFNRYARPVWMKRMADHGNGVMLIPAAKETDAFAEHVWKRAGAVCFLLGRPHFHFVDGTRAKFNCGAAIALCAYGQENIESLRNAGLGKFIEL